MIPAVILKSAGERQSRMAGFTSNWTNGLGFSKSWARTCWKPSPGGFAMPSPDRGHACCIMQAAAHPIKTDALNLYGRLYFMTPEEYKMLRKEIGTQTKVARLLGVSRTTIWQRETGGRTINREAELAIESLYEKR